MPLAGRYVENLAQPFDLRRQVERVIADEKALIVRQVGVRQVVDAFIVVVLDDVVPSETAAGDDAIADIGFLEPLAKSAGATVRPRD